MTTIDATPTTSASPEAITDEVRARYAEAALSVLGRGEKHADASAGCCSPSVMTDPADPAWGQLLYDATDRAALPDAAVLASLGCGNPTAVAELRPGEVVLDLGSGGGIDVLLSASRVGPTGFAYGLDMTDEMLELARATRPRPAPRTSSSARAGSNRSRSATPRSTSSSATASSISRPTRPRSSPRSRACCGRAAASASATSSPTTPCPPTSAPSAAASSAASRAPCPSPSTEPGSRPSASATSRSRPPIRVGDGLHGAIVKATKPAAGRCRTSVRSISRSRPTRACRCSPKAAAAAGTVAAAAEGGRPRLISRLRPGTAAPPNSGASRLRPCSSKRSSPSHSTSMSDVAPCTARSAATRATPGPHIIPCPAADAIVTPPMTDPSGRIAGPRIGRWSGV